MGTRMMICPSYYHKIQVIFCWSSVEIFQKWLYNLVINRPNSNYHQMVKGLHNYYNTVPNISFLNEPFPASFFFIFVFSKQLTVNIQYKFCRWLDSNRIPPLYWKQPLCQLSHNFFPITNYKIAINHYEETRIWSGFIGSMFNISIEGN